VYHCGTDFALQTASALFFQQKQVVGLAGPAQKWRGLTSVDVSNHFGFFVHTNYRNVLEKIVINHRQAYETTKTEDESQIGTEGDTVMVTEKVHHQIGTEDETVVMTERATPHQIELELDWYEGGEKKLLDELEHEIVLLERANEEEKKSKDQILESGKAVESISATKGLEGGKALEGRKETAKAEGESKTPQTILEVLQNRKELVEMGKEFLSNVKELLDNRKQLFEQAKTLASVALESSQKVLKK
jgi:hypothetical protein